MNQNPPRISVVVAAYNSKRTIGQCLASLLALDYPWYEVIVVDDGSTDGTPEICAAYESVRLIRLDRGGPSRARNVGIDLALGEIVAFTDSDCVVSRDWLREIEKGFVDDRVAGVGGNQVSPEGESEFGRMVQDFFRAIGFVTDYINLDSTLRETRHNPSCNSAYRKSVLKEVGGFVEGQFPCEDLELDLKIRKLGYLLIYNPNAVVGHFRPGGYAGFARMMRRYGSGEWLLWRKHGFFRKLDHVPWILLLGLLATFFLVGSNWMLLLLAVLTFLGVWAWFYIRGRSLTRSLRYTTLFFLTLVFWNWGFFTGFRYRPGA